MAKSSETYVRCQDCSNAIFMQWFDNPVVAYCFERRDRQVAQSERLCTFYKPSGNSHPEVAHFDCYENGQTDELIHNALRKRNL